jgi:hypothetical protein
MRVAPPVVLSNEQRKTLEQWARSRSFFRDLTQNRLRRGIFRDVEELIMAIGDYIDKHNSTPKPFIWSAKASDILEKVKRARTKLDNGYSLRRKPLNARCTPVP